jgi:hypothetical protein
MKVLQIIEKSEAFLEALDLIPVRIALAKCSSPTFRPCMTSHGFKN